MQSTSLSPWYRESEAPVPTPVAGDSAKHVAEYLIEVEENGLHCGDNWYPLSTHHARRYCEQNGHNWKQVSPAMRELKSLGLSRHIGDPALSRTRGGVVVNQSLLDALGDLWWLPLCPRVQTGFSTFTFSHFTVGGDCEKWWCPKCGARRLDELLEQIRARITDLDLVYVAVADYERKLPGRVRTRHKEVPGSQYFWFRRDDGRVFYLATVAVTGGRSTAAPSNWTAMRPAEAIEWLQTTVMVLPGYHDHDWSKDWKPPTVKKSEAYDELKGEAEYRYFQINEQQALRVYDLFSDIVKQRFGCDPDTISAQNRGDALELLQDTVREVKESGFGRSQG
jgi:hypothetical protein